MMAEANQEEAEQFYAKLETALQMAGVYHGIPLGALMPVEGFTLVGKTRDPRLAAYFEQNDIKPNPADKKIRNLWEVRRWKGPEVVYVVLYEEENGRVRYELVSHPSSEKQRMDLWMRTATARTNMTLLSAEWKAKKTLQTMLSDRQWLCYDLDGAFIERSKRSHLIYILRKSRPTLVLNPNNGSWQPICCLCLHPLAYYAATWAGALPPSDEVIAHLMYIRGDEAGFWRKANQIPIHRAASGV